MDEQADAINIELDRQINQLDKIYDDLKDTETTLKRYVLLTNLGPKST